MLGCIAQALQLTNNAPDDLAGDTNTRRLVWQLHVCAVPQRGRSFDLLRFDESWAAAITSVDLRVVTVTVTATATVTRLCSAAS